MLLQSFNCVVAIVKHLCLIKSHNLDAWGIAVANNCIALSIPHNKWQDA